MRSDVLLESLGAWLPLTHSPEGGCQWCWIARGVPTPRLLGVVLQQLRRTVLFGMPAWGCEGDPSPHGRFFFWVAALGGELIKNLLQELSKDMTMRVGVW